MILRLFAWNLISQMSLNNWKRAEETKQWILKKKISLDIKVKISNKSIASWSVKLIFVAIRL